MPKHPNSRSKKPLKRDETMNTAMKLFLAGCVAELYLLIVRRFYIKGTAVQQIAWYDNYLIYLLVAGVAVLILGAVLAYLWRQDKKKRVVGWVVAGAGAFLTVSSGAARWNMSTVTLMAVVVPVVMLLGVLWNLYERECALSLTILSASLIVLWVCRRLSATVLYVKVGAVIYVAALAAVVWLARQGKLSKLLPAKADPLPVYVACGLSIAALAAALLLPVLATYAMWAMAIVVFGLAVYYTVKQL